MPNSIFSKTVFSTLKQRHWLELAEYVSLASSAIGSGVVALSGQAFYGVAPLTLALSLNVANRYRLEQQTHQNQIEIVQVQDSVEKLEKNTVKVVMGLRQQLLQEIQSLQQKLEAFPTTEALDSAYRAKQVAALGQSVTSITENIALALAEIREEFRQELQTFSSTETANLESLAVNVRQLQDVAHELRNNAVTQEDFQGRFLEIQDVINQLQQEKSGQSASDDLSLIQTRLDELTQEHQEVIKPHLRRLLSVVKQLQTTNSQNLPIPPKPLPKNPQP
jgi:Mg2+ and Co2+ transporters